MLERERETGMFLVSGFWLRVASWQFGKKLDQARETIWDGKTN